MSDDMNSAGVRKRDELLRVLLAVIVVASVVLIPELVAFKFSSLSMDEGFLLEYPVRILQGALPNRDFLNFYGPGNFYLISLLFKIFGAGFFVERMVALTYHMAIALGVFAISCRWGLFVAVCSGSLSAFLLAGLHLLAYSWLGMLAFFIWSIFLLSRALATGSGRKVSLLLTAAGILMGFAISFRLESTPVLFLSIIPLLQLAGTRQRCIFMAGLILGLVPLAVHCAIVTPSAMLWDVAYKVQLILENRKQMGTWTNVSLLVLLTPLLSALVTLTAGIRCVLIAPREQSARTLLSLGLLSIGILPQISQLPEWGHVLQVDCIALGFLPTALVALLPGTASWTPARKRFAVVCLLAIVVITHWDLTRNFGGSLLRSLGLRPSSSFQISHQGRACLADSREEADQLSSLLAEVDRTVPRGGRLFVFPRYPIGASGSELFLYFLLPELQPASYCMYVDYATSYPKTIHELARTQLANDLTSADAIILQSSRKGFSDYLDSGDLTLMCPAIRDHFYLAAKFGTRELYLRTHSPGTDRKDSSF